MTTGKKKEQVEGPSEGRCIKHSKERVNVKLSLCLSASHEDVWGMEA
jgi:hypothetical protein